MNPWRLVWILFAIVALSIHHILAQKQSHLKTTNLTKNDFSKQPIIPHSRVKTYLTETSANARGFKNHNEKGYEASQSVGRRISTAKLFNFECGNRYEPPEDEGLRLKRFIAGGYDAGPYSYPSYMKLMISIGGFMYNKCGGTLISRQHIITATHCFPNGHREVFAESTIYQQPSPSRLRVARVCHMGVATSDITILRLAKPVRFTPTCQPACLPDTPLTSSMTAITVGLGANHISSWNSNNVGNPDELQALPVRRVQCKFGDRDKARICFRPSMEEFTGASCKGDSGGPTYASVNGKQTVYSVVSYGSDHICEAGRPGYSVNGDIYNLRNPIINLMKTC